MFNDAVRRLLAVYGLCVLALLFAHIVTAKNNVYATSVFTTLIASRPPTLQPGR